MADDFIFDINSYVQGNNGNILPITIRNKGAVVDITGTMVRVAIKKGDYLFTKQAVIIDATTGKCEVTLTREDLATAGGYSYQPTITYPDDREFSGDVEKFRVSGKLTGAPPVITPGMIELARLGINANGKLTIDGVEQIGGGGTLPSNAILFEDWTGGESVTIDPGTTPPLDATAPILTISPNGGTFATTQGVTMTTNETAVIYYTLDGSTPTTASTVYSTALSFSETTTLKAFAKDTAGNSSAVQTVTFTKDATAPPDTTAPVVTATPTAGTYTSAQSVSLSANETATIYYTTNGTTPTTSSTVYSAPIQVSATTTLQYMAVDTAGNPSVPVASTYTINIADTTAPVLTMTPAGTFTDTKTVTMSANETATIYYTLDDSDPITSGTKLTYTAPLTLTATDTIKAYAKDTAGNDSAVQTVTYTKESGTAPGTILFNDTFNRTDSTTLGVADTGQTWTMYSSGNGTYNFGIRGNITYPSGGTFITGVNKWRRFSKTTIASNNFSIEVKTKSPVGTGAMGIGIRLLATDDNMVYLRKSQAIGQAASQYTVSKYPAGGSVSVLGTGTVLAGENDTIKIEHYSSGLIKVYINGVLDISVTDTLGLGASTTVGLGMETDLVGHGFDDFKITAM